LNGAALLGIGLKHLRSVIFELASTTYDVLSEQYPTSRRICSTAFGGL
jgi:hypothetical protein